MLLAVLAFAGLSVSAQKNEEENLNQKPTAVIVANDVSGDGRSDFVVVRNDGPSSLTETQGVTDYTGKNVAETMRNRAALAPDAVGSTWYEADSNQTPRATFLFGVNTDTFIMANVVGDNKSDLVVWRQAANAAFYVMDSGTNTVSVYTFGTNGDVPTVLNDFNNDGRDDLAVYRQGVTGSPQSVFYWASTTAPTAVTAIPWGTVGDVGFTLDYDGDRKADVAIQRNVGGTGQFWVRRSSDGATEVINNFGFGTDFIVPGDYNGDGRDDICVSRNLSGFKYFFPRDSATGNVSFIQWGIPGDVVTQSDYDGDGKTDVAVWRPGAVGGNGVFYVMKSTGGVQTFIWGRNGDYPVNNWNVH